MVGMDRKKENSSAEARDMPATCPAAMVAIEREVPGKTAERIWQPPIQTACHRLISSMWSIRGRVKRASTAHMTTPPISRAPADDVQALQVLADHLAEQEGGNGRHHKGHERQAERVGQNGAVAALGRGGRCGESAMMRGQK